MPIVKIVLDAWLDDLKEDVLMEVNKNRKLKFLDFSSWVRFGFRDYIPNAYRNLQKYLRTENFMGSDVKDKLEPLEDETLSMLGKKYVMAIHFGKRQTQLLRELVPFENLIRKINIRMGKGTLAIFKSVPDFVRFRVVNQMLDVHHRMLVAELNDEEEALLKEIEKAAIGKAITEEKNEE